MVPPIATESLRSEQEITAPAVPIKEQYNQMYTPIADGEVDTYEYKQYKPVYPEVNWEPLKPMENMVDRGTLADPSKKNFLSAASKVTNVMPAIGTKVEGVDLRHLTNAQKDELALLIAERSVVIFEDQEINIQEQLELARYFAPLHKHATTPIPREPGLDEVHVVYADGTKRPDPEGFSKIELWHGDDTYELNPPGYTSLKLITAPTVGGDTLFMSGYYLYSSLSPEFQKYMETLSCVHSGVAQAQATRAAGAHVRRQEIETIHPLVRVHPVTGWKSIFVNPVFTRKIVGVPKSESNAILTFLFHRIADEYDGQVRVQWKKNQVVFWDNRIVAHSASYDYFPQKRHALRATPHAERPMSVAEYQKDGKVAGDRGKDILKMSGYDLDAPAIKAKEEAARKYVFPGLLLC